MIEIDQERLCEHCERDENRCEGSGCDEARESYLDDHGLIEQPASSFKSLRIGDMVFRLKTKDTVPSIEHLTVSKVGLNDSGTGSMWIKFQGETLSADIPSDVVAKNTHGGYFTSKKDCESRLEELCVQRIIELSRVIGSTGEPRK